jgi:hypothetical protein
LGASVTRLNQIPDRKIDLPSRRFNPNPVELNQSQAAFFRVKSLSSAGLAPILGDFANE